MGPIPGILSSRSRSVEAPIISSSAVTLLAASADGHILAAALESNAVWLLRSATGEKLAHLAPPDALTLHALTFSPDGATLAAGTGSQAVLVWDMRALPVELGKMNLDWPAAPFPIAAPAPPARVIVQP